MVKIEILYMLPGMINSTSAMLPLITGVIRRKICLQIGDLRHEVKMLNGKKHDSINDALTSRKVAEDCYAALERKINTFRIQEKEKIDKLNEVWYYIKIYWVDQKVRRSWGLLSGWHFNLGWLFWVSSSRVVKLWYFLSVSLTPLTSINGSDFCYS